jgi:hypothetical protein
MSNLQASDSQTNAKEPAATPAGRSLLNAGNRLKLGLFGFNCSNGLSLTSAETSFDASWDQTLAIARRASAIRIDFNAHRWECSTCRGYIRMAPAFSSRAERSPTDKAVLPAFQVPSDQGECAA